MTELVAFLSTGKGTWGHVNRLLQGMSGEKWEKIYLLTNDFSIQNFKAEEGVELIELTTKNLDELSNEIQTKLKEKITGMEIAVNFVSGDGREHMALVSALIKMGLGFRLVGLNKEDNVIEF
ncbi:hypothetical protein HOK09_00935 [Candidatus Woesearchaeota archaeon]|nr:hypothetical protein [Candidatus Woesearchaeota archaeon]